MGSEGKQPSVIAKLMGLDALPVQHAVSVARKDASNNSIYNACKIGNANHEQPFPGKVNSRRSVSPGSWNLNPQVHEQHFKDVHVVRKQQRISNTRNNDMKNEPLSMESHNSISYEKRMALVHQKFLEAKHLARNENLLQSREFQDALEVLSLNQDLFVRFLEEPNLWVSKHLQKFSPNPLNQDKYITVLKPSKALPGRIEEPSLRDDLYAAASVVNKPICKNMHQTTHPSRIVVLKPNPGKSYNMKDQVSFPSSSQRSPEKDHAGELGDHEARSSREVAKEITRKMQERLGTYRKDGVLLSSVPSNRYRHGHGGTSLNRSLNECLKEECDEAFLHHKTPRHSWDNADRCVSPSSFLSINHASSYSTKPSVALASNGTIQNQHRTHDPSILGKMLTVSESKKGGGNEVPSAFCDTSSARRYNQESNHSELSERRFTKSSSILRSVGAPTDEFPTNRTASSSVSKEANMQKTAQSQLKGKLLNLFSSRNKKSTGCHPPSPSAQAIDNLQCKDVFLGVNSSNHLTQCSMDISEGPQHNYEDILKLNFCSSSPEQGQLGQGSPSAKETLALEMKRLSENATENMEQPSPISVLENIFEEEESNSSSSAHSETANSECFGLVSRGPSIESVARSLSWDNDDHMETCNLKSTVHSTKETEERITFVKNLLSSTGIGNETSEALVSRLYSLGSPFDAAILDKHVEPKQEGAKSRQRRSNQRLLIDCVNFVMLEIIRDEDPDISKISRVCIKEENKKAVALSLTDKVVMRMEELFSLERKGTSESGEVKILAIDSLIQKQGTGKEWEEVMKTETAEIRKEVERHILDELVSEVLDGIVMGFI